MELIDRETLRDSINKTIEYLEIESSKWNDRDNPLILQQKEAVGCGIEVLRQVKVLINQSPTIESRLQGKWIVTENEYMDDEYKCPFCKYEFTLYEGTPKESDINYCPNCGAKMEEE